MHSITVTFEIFDDSLIVKPRLLDIGLCENKSRHKKREVERRTIAPKHRRIHQKKPGPNCDGPINFICSGKIMITNGTPLFQSVSFDQLYWAELADRFSERLV
jgi:hypothetical protein